DGRLLIVSGPEGKLLVRRPDGSLETYADLSPLSPYSWNELVVDGRGSAYVNSINFDLMGGGEYAPGLVALVTPDGAVRRLADGLAFPNGRAITPDTDTLIVAESYSKALSAYDVAADGSLSNRRVWAQTRDGADGIGLDADGAVWVASRNRCVRLAEGGEELD